MLAVAKATDGLSIEYVDDSLRSQKKFILEVIESLDTPSGDLYFSYVPEELKQDREVAYAAVSKDGDCLSDVSEILRNDKELVLAALKTGGSYTFKYASDELRQNRDVIIQAVTYRGSNLEWAKAFQNDKEVVLAALSNPDSYVFEMISPELRADPDVIEANERVNGA